ncbi:hypothetical protein [Cytobacillus sp.]|uniref:hypothetical protein n=1 Tax=Cytobacillus sp. TaxID=2675269 RepID=UPI0028BD4039|nr:hypothetical protein [Cytobacillus sp.]
MTTNHTQEILNAVKKIGQKVELELNNSIHDVLNQPSILKTINNQSRLAAASISKLQQTVETLSIPFNFPTKNDVASTTKLFIQAEEKLDLLEEQVTHLNRSFEELKDTIAKSHSRGII